MSRSIGNSIADSLSLALGYARRMLTDVTPETFARFGAPGGQVVESNHAAFCYGHLSLYACRVIRELGGDEKAVTPPEVYFEKFKDGVKCIDDADSTYYPPMEEITASFFKYYETVLEALRAAPDEAFQKENPHGGRLTELFPSIGSMHAFYCGGHIMMHLGQVSAWRRMHGLNPA